MPLVKALHSLPFAVDRFRQIIYTVLRAMKTIRYGIRKGSALSGGKFSCAITRANPGFRPAASSASVARSPDRSGTEKWPIASAEAMKAAITNVGAYLHFEYEPNF